MAEIQSTTWDVIVVGGGMGGGAAAFSLSRNGLRVLLVEQGKALFPDASSSAKPDEEDPETRLREGRWPTKISMNIDGSTFDVWPALGCGLGGSSIHYAAALSRLDRVDFETQTLPTGESISWPFQYADLESYYLEAEKQLLVSGTPDPMEHSSTYQLLPPPAMKAPDREFFNFLRHTGLHPYRLHMGVRYVEGCTGCGGYFCRRECKSDARNRFILPAQEGGNLSVLTDAEVVKVRMQGTRAEGVDVIHDGTVQSIRGRVVVLSAGALFTPKILLNSTSDVWPQGLGNAHDTVGRNLMFHASDFILVWARHRAGKEGSSRSLAFRDFYIHEGVKYGEFQSMGLVAGYGEILTYLHQRWNQSPFRKLRLLKETLRLPAFIAHKLFKDAGVYSTIVEDFPYSSNRVVADATSSSGVRLEYQVRDELRSRVRTSRALIRSALRGRRMLILNQNVSLNYGHPCGTCRSGVNPRNSVVDSDCRIHDVANVYIADGSVMPTSGGTNPSLTIAAIGLRIGDGVAARLAAEVTTG